jgi:hypothetical protein
MTLQANRRQGLLNGRGFPTFSFFPIQLFGHGISLLGVPAQTKPFGVRRWLGEAGSVGAGVKRMGLVCLFKSVMIINDLVSLFQDAQRAIEPRCARAERQCSVDTSCRKFKAAELSALLYCYLAFRSSMLPTKLNIRFYLPKRELDFHPPHDRKPTHTRL